MNALWLQDNRSQPSYQRVLQRFGWTSGCIGHELVYGYRVAEAKLVYFMWCDDSFLTEMTLDPSCYGEAVFPPLPAGKKARGNIVIYKVLLKNQRRKPPVHVRNPQSTNMFQLTDDADMEFEFALAPVNKAETALMLSERKKCMEKGAYTALFMWRHPIRDVEKYQEVEKINAYNGHDGAAAARLTF